MTFIPNQDMFRKNTLDLERAGTWHDVSSLSIKTRKFQSWVESLHKQNDWEGILASGWKGYTTLITVVHFDPQKKRVSSVAKYPPSLLFNETEQLLLRAQTLTFCSTLGLGQGKKEAKKATFPTLLTMIVAIFCRWKCLRTLFSKRKNNAKGLFF